MSNRNYSLIFKEINDFSTIGLEGVVSRSFYENQKVNYEVPNAKGEKNLCQIKVAKMNENYIFGKFGNIKDSSSENSTTIVHGKEYSDVDIKYIVQFLIDIKNAKLIYIYNKNATNFEEDIKYWIEQQCGTINCFQLLDIKSEDLNKKIKKAKKITSIIVNKRDLDSIRSLSSEFIDDFPVSSVKIVFKVKEKNIDKEKLANYVSANKQSNYKIDFIDSDDVQRTTKFTEYLFSKKRIVSLSKEEIRKEDFIFELLKENLER